MPPEGLVLDWPSTVLSLTAAEMEATRVRSSLSVILVSCGFQLPDLLPRSLNKALDKTSGGFVDAFDYELGVVKVGQSLFEVAQAGGDLRMHGVGFL